MNSEFGMNVSRSAGLILIRYNRNTSAIADTEIPHSAFRIPNYSGVYSAGITLCGTRQPFAAIRVIILLAC